MDKSLVSLVNILLFFPAAYAVNYTVGGTSGWTIGFNYTTWASGQNFTTGDTLVFNYDSSHAVDEVNQADYQNCSTGNSITSQRTSPTKISLDTTGTRYFICPTPTHCSRGQRLAVNITGGSAGGSVPSTPSATPGTPPPPPPQSAAAMLVGGNSLMVGLMSLVLAAMVGLMG